LSLFGFAAVVADRRLHPDPAAEPTAPAGLPRSGDAERVRP